MKITDATKSSRISRGARTKSGASPAAAGPQPITDSLSIAGIPEAELTPRVRKAVMTLLSEVSTLRKELAESRERISALEELADTDPLVGILNRRAFVRELNRALAMVERYNTPSSLIFVDVNAMKAINDRLGHAAGDAALGHVVDVLTNNVRQTDLLGRLGGDEFGVILVQTGYADARAKADALTRSVAEMPVPWKDIEFKVSVTCGVVEIQKGATADQALETADNAMYRNKRQR